jgi:hypothetical protein
MWELGMGNAFAAASAMGRWIFGAADEKRIMGVKRAETRPVQAWRGNCKVKLDWELHLQASGESS